MELRRSQSHQSRRAGTCAILVAGILAGFAGTSVSAGLTFSTAPAPGGFIQACAGPSTPGSNPWPGSDHTALFTAPGSDVNELPFVGDTTAMETAAYAAGSTSNSCAGNVGLGFAKLAAQNNAPNNSFFAAAMAHGGWSEHLTVTSPGLAGQPGFLVFSLDVKGGLAAAGFAGSGQFIVTGYKDAAQLLANPLFDPGNSDLLSSDRQYGHWAVATFSVGESTSKFVDDTVTFAVPITFGTPFKLGIYARARASMRSSSGVPGNSTATSDFSDGLVWGGVASVMHGGAPVGTYTITGESGVDWDGPVGPDPTADLNGDGVVDGADLGLMLAAWGTPDADLNGDGTTDGADLGLLLGQWI